MECYLPAQTSLKKTVRRRRRKDAVTLNPDLALADEMSLLSLTIPAPLLEPYKFFDSGPGPDRVLILTNDANLDFLCESVRWCGDGTLKAAPKLWTRLYTIHGQKNGYTVPCVFALLPNKRKESYNLVFSKIKSWIDVVSQNWQFEAYLSDFEKGDFLAAVEVFPGIASEGCFFHLSKRLDYHVKSLGDTDFRIRVKKLAALAFIPVVDVIPAFESLSTHFLQDELPLLAYFEKTWIVTRRLTPDFPIQMWNALERSAAGSTRTTNALEAYHYAFNALISCQHPSVWKFVDSLRNQQALTANTMQRIQRGRSFRPKPTEAAMNTRIVNLITSYTRATADSFLRGIAFNYMS